VSGAGGGGELVPTVTAPMVDIRILELLGVQRWRRAPASPLPIEALGDRWWVAAQRCGGASSPRPWVTGRAGGRWRREEQ
jgi:hypothetical protein